MENEVENFLQCPNCGKQCNASDKFCPNCGQHNHSINVPLKHFLLEIIESTFHFETKTFSTLRDMFLHPGLITKNFNENKRARYVPPIRLYIFLSFIFFMVLAINTVKPSRSEKQKELRRDSAGNIINPYIRPFSIMSGDSADGDFISEINEDSLSEVKFEINGKMDKFSYVDSVKKAELKDLPDTLSYDYSEFWIYNSLRHKAVDFQTFRKNLHRDLKQLSAFPLLGNEACDKYWKLAGVEAKWYNRGFLRNFLKLKTHHLSQEEFIHILLKKISFLLFLLMPLVALFIRLLHYRSGFYYSQHLIFSIYLHSFFFVVFSLWGLIVLVFDDISLSWLVFPGLFIYTVIAIKRVYAQKLRRVILKTLMLGVFYSISLVIFLALALVLSLM
jgi:hypothetical protein